MQRNIGDMHYSFNHKSGFIEIYCDYKAYT